MIPFAFREGGQAPFRPCEIPIPGKAGGRRERIVSRTVPSVCEGDSKVTTMEMCPIESTSRIIPTKICREGKWVTAVPIAVAFVETEASGVFKKLRRRVSEQRRRIQSLLSRGNRSGSVILTT